MGNLLPEEVQQMFTELWDRDGLIIDLRNHADEAIYPMFNYLFHGTIPLAKFTIPSVTYPGTISWDSIIAPAIPMELGVYNKDIAIVFNENTISHAEYTAMILEQYKKSVKIGSQTTGADGNFTSIFLPDYVSANLTGLGWFYPDGKPTQRIGITPDIEVKPTIAAIRAARDELLEIALEKVAGNNEIKPDDFVLRQNYPNPFNPVTNICFSLRSKALVKLDIYNSSGGLVKTAVQKELAPGFHNYKFNASEMSSGVYFYKINVNGSSLARKMLMIK